MSRLRVCRPGEHRPLCPSGWERRLRGSVALRPFRVCAPGTFTRVYCSACGGRWRRGSPRQALAVLRVLWESVHLSGQLWAWGHRGHGLSLCPLVLKEKVYVALQRQREQCQGRCRACPGEETGGQRRLVWLLVARGWPRGSPRPMSGAGGGGMLTRGRLFCWFLFTVIFLKIEGFFEIHAK